MYFSIMRSHMPSSLESLRALLKMWLLCRARDSNQQPFVLWMAEKCNSVYFRRCRTLPFPSGPCLSSQRARLRKGSPCSQTASSYVWRLWRPAVPAIGKPWIHRDSFPWEGWVLKSFMFFDQIAAAWAIKLIYRPKKQRNKKQGESGFSAVDG